MTECDMSLQVFLGSLTRICSISMTLYYAALIIPKRNPYLSSSNAKDTIRFGGDMRDLTEILVSLRQQFVDFISSRWQDNLLFSSHP